MRWQRYNFYFIKNTLKIKNFSGKFSRLFKRSPFGLQKDYIWEAKGVLLEGKRITFGGQKESF